MTQTIKERLELLKKNVGNAPADDAVPSEHRAFGFNAGVDACLPLLEEVVREVIELVKTNVPYVTGDQERLIQEIDNLFSNTQ